MVTLTVPFNNRSFQLSVQDSDHDILIPAVLGIVEERHCDVLELLLVSLEQYVLSLMAGKD